MPVPEYGAAPLAKTFVLVRGLSLISIICIVGMTANFVSEIVGSGVEAPREIVGTLTITCLAALYCLISIPFFYAHANLGLLIMTAADFLLLLAFVIVSVVVGKPLSFLNCVLIERKDDDARAAVAFTRALAQNLGRAGSTLGLGDWAGSTRVNCYETKAIWGFAISLAILFTCSCAILPTLWVKAKKAGGGGGGKEVA